MISQDKEQEDKVYVKYNSCFLVLEFSTEYFIQSQEKDLSKTC